jgi:hypothetical protein
LTAVGAFTSQSTSPGPPGEGWLSLRTIGTHRDRCLDTPIEIDFSCSKPTFKRAEIEKLVVLLQLIDEFR